MSRTERAVALHQSCFALSHAVFTVFARDLAEEVADYVEGLFPPEI